MAGILPKYALLFIIFFYFNGGAAGKSLGFSRVLNPATIGLKKEKLTHFRLFWHDIVIGRNQSAVKVAAGPATNASATMFGAVSIIDDALTEGPELSSKLLGRAQGLYSSASKSEVGLFMAMNFAFMVGKYNGSTITILGRNTVFSKVREMPVIGGSGLFRFARGYAQARTQKFDNKSGNAIVEYNIFILHY
ncbi:hypothetical protein HHK36_012048 [Tetracentron sinense]|uniref:Dirigent protein n=1 Tax=Tetracentron sinense TaxID=13715 RepID=A0A834ZHJ5_TETSI|nr:hypothetical protein HHK36_012048 [Tetracentron sinense]